MHLLASAHACICVCVGGGACVRACVRVCVCLVCVCGVRACVYAYIHGVYNVSLKIFVSDMSYST